MGPGTGQ